MIQRRTPKETETTMQSISENKRGKYSTIFEAIVLNSLFLSYREELQKRRRGLGGASQNTEATPNQTSMAAA